MDRRRSTAMIAVQGPRAIELAGHAVGQAFVSSIAGRGCAEVEWEGEMLFASRTGYTGEDGLELVVSAQAGPELWRRLLVAGIQPCGLGARDTLRLEAALLLYGNDMGVETNHYEVGLGWAVSLDDDADFVGRQALLRIRESGRKRALVCLKALDRGIMRAGYSILHSGSQAGKVSSGGFSPHLGGEHRPGIPAPAAGEGGDGASGGRTGQAAASASGGTSLLQAREVLYRERGEVPNPSDLRYTQEHEWVRVEDGEGTIGITDYAQDQLGDIVYVDLPTIGTQIVATQKFGEIESVKAISDLNSPATGEIVAVEFGAGR